MKDNLGYMYRIRRKVKWSGWVEEDKSYHLSSHLFIAHLRLGLVAETASFPHSP